jgi:hypothetical protein
MIYTTILETNASIYVSAPLRKKAGRKTSNTAELLQKRFTAAVKRSKGLDRDEVRQHMEKLSAE